LGKNTDVTFKNTYLGPPVPTTGGITITKAIDGNPTTASTFTFTIEGTRYSNSVSITGARSETINNLLPGTYTITESDVANYTPDSVSKTAIVVAGKNTPITFTNTYSGGETNPTPGSITIHKVIYKDNEQEYTDPDPDNPPVFTFTVSLTDEDVRLSEAKSYTVKITGAGIATIEDLDPGAYTVTEVNYPENYRPLDNNLPVTLDAGENEQVYFTNVYTEPEDEPSVRIYKTVAEYDGINIPNNSSFEKQLNFTMLNKQVIYKIDLTCDNEIEQTTVRLEDIYNLLNITDNLLVLDNGSLVEANTVYSDDEFPDYIGVNYESFTTFYYKDTLTSYGTYTNTAYLYEPYYERATSVSEYPEAPEALASSSAVVIVNNPGGGTPTGGGGGGSSHHNYQVIYDANYPAATGTSGTVPIDNNDYSYNSKVIVKGNTGDLKVEKYSFTGWNTKADGTGTAYQPSDSFNIKSDVTLYAHWKAGDEVTPAANDEGNAAALSAVTTDSGLDDIPKTGDSTPVVPMLLLGFLSLAAIALLGRKNAVDTATK
ncbi:MAG: SpaA isopeptide-forming pilin-related protein, partial [Bacillota bacterium]